VWIDSGERAASGADRLMAFPSQELGTLSTLVDTLRHVVSTARVLFDEVLF